MKIPPQGQFLNSLNRGEFSLTGLGNAPPVVVSPQSPLNALAELEQWRVKAEETCKQAVSWSMSSCPLRVWIEPYPDSDDLKTAATPEALFSVLRQWEAATGSALTFRQITNPFSRQTAEKEADILILWDSQTTLGRDYEVGHTNRQVQGKRIRQASITLITQPLIDARLSLLERQQRLYTTVLHEVGHALGLEHSDDHRDVMHHRGWRHVCLSENDIRRIRQLYEVRD